MKPVRTKFYRYPGMENELWVNPMHAQWFALLEIGGGLRVSMQTSTTAATETVETFATREDAEAFIRHLFIPGDL